ncbi:hypothetical protein BGZ76_008991 [Entomortierella beljakovae]|nr:hypothetical protein BGZ76_008991 [Entomortierella beljakovae]
MTTVAKRLEEVHKHLLQLYTSIPVLTPCLEKIKANQSEFVAANGRVRQLQESCTSQQIKVDKLQMQLSSVFALNKSDLSATLKKETSELKAIEDERRVCLRQRDVIVTERYKLQSEQKILLEETRQLKKVNESVFDRSKDEVANADFPEELHWQLELREYDYKIDQVRLQLTKYNTALSCLARAANLSEAALMAFLGYPDAAYKVWNVEYALKASQKMRLSLRVELSLSNAYSNEDSAREACPAIFPQMAAPIKLSAIQAYFGNDNHSVGGKRVQRFNSEPELRTYIAHLRSAHKSSEFLVAQEKERLDAMQKYRESIIPLLSKIRRRAFQDSCLGGMQLEGWEDDHGNSLLGTEADILVRGGIHVVGTPTFTDLAPRASMASSSSSSAFPSSSAAPNPQHRGSVDDNTELYGHFSETRRDWRGNIVYPQENEETTNTGRRRSNEQEPSTSSNQQLLVHGGRASVNSSTVPLSVISPANVLGSEVLMMVDRERHVRMESNRSSSENRRFRSRSRSRRDSDQMNGVNGSGSGSNSNNPDVSSSGNNSNQGEQEGRKRNSRGLFGFTRSRHGTANGDDPNLSSSPPSSPIFLLGRTSRSTVDLTGPTTEGENTDRGHRRNVPSISISAHDENRQGLQGQQAAPRRTFFENSSLVQLPSYTGASIGSNPPSPPIAPTTAPRMLSMDEYIGIGQVEISSNGYENLAHESQLIPSYAEHQQDTAIDPDMLHLMNTSISYEGLSAVAEQDEENQSNNNAGSSSSSQGHAQLLPPDARSANRSRSASPHSRMRLSHSIDIISSSGSSSSGFGDGGINMNAGRAPHQRHNYSFSDQTPDGRLPSIGMLIPPPDYATVPPEYRA